MLLTASVVGAQSAADSFNPGADGQIYTAAVQPDGKLVVGGNFTMIGGGGSGTISRKFIARLNPDGTVDTGFNPGADGSVAAIALQSDGKILVGGQFSKLGGGGATARQRLARLNSDGTLDTAFDPGANGSVQNLIVQPDGNILVSGDFSLLGGGGSGANLHLRIGRLDPSGKAETGFSAGADNLVYSLALQSDGKVVAGGTFHTLSSGGTTRARSYIGRFNADGTVDTAFDPGANNFVIALAVQRDGKIWVGGSFDTIGGGGTGGLTHPKIARLSQDGSVDPTMSAHPDEAVTCLALQTNGKMLLGGFFFVINQPPFRNTIARLNTDATVDADFDPGSDVFMNMLVPQADGKIVVGGSMHHLGGGGTGVSPREFIGRVTNTEPALQELIIQDPSTIFWHRIGALSEVDRAIFELSFDGINYLLLDQPTRATDGWLLTNQSLPQQRHLYVRARGFYSTSGYAATSGSITQTVRELYLSRNPTVAIISTSRSADGHFSLTGVGLPNTNYTIQASLNLSAGSFETIGVATADNNGSWTYDDSVSVALGTRFYRASNQGMQRTFGRSAVSFR